MAASMGEIIKHLRKEQGLTQEELAEQLGVSAPAVSKWENGGGMPDISQIVPLSRIFGVSTDVLFGVADRDDTEDVKSIMERAQSALTSPLTTECLKKRYGILQKGLTLHPKNPILLTNSLEAGIALAYPENDVYDAENGKSIYKECIRQANLVFSYSQNTTDVLRAHMIMVMLHSAYGNFEQAEKHAQKFPWRADMTVHKMYAYYAHWKKDYKTEAASRQYGFLFLLEAMLDTITNLGITHTAMNEHRSAQKTFETAIELINLITAEEEMPPAFHRREKGDIYVLFARSLMQTGDTEKALNCLERSVDLEIEARARFADAGKPTSPLLRDVPHKKYLYRLPIDRLHVTLDILNEECFAPLRENARFTELLRKAEHGLK